MNSSFETLRWPLIQAAWKATQHFSGMLLIVATLIAATLITATLGAQLASADQDASGQDASNQEAPPDTMPIRVVDSADRTPIAIFRVIAGVPSRASRQFESAHQVQVINWQSHQLREGTDGVLFWPTKRGYPEMALRVEADGYVPHVFFGLNKGQLPKQLNGQLTKDPGIQGSVMTPGGKRPAQDATVVLAMIRRNARLVGSDFPKLDLRPLDANSSLRDRWDRPTVVQPDTMGRFTLPTEPDPTAVVLIIHPDGVLQMPFAEWKKSPNVTLEPWGRIHGTIRWGDKLGAGEPVDLSCNHGDQYGYPEIVSQSDSTTANEQGAFVFERVLPGGAQIASPTKVKTKAGQSYTIYSQGKITHANVIAPHTSVLVGGRGRTVTGRLSDTDNYAGVTLHFHPNAPHVGFPGDDQMWSAWNQLKTSDAGPLFFREGIQVNNNGTFTIPKVLPGHYQIFFSRDGEKQFIASSKFRVLPENPDTPPDPVDIGEIKIRSR